MAPVVCAIAVRVSRGLNRDDRSTAYATLGRTLLGGTGQACR